ncbi:MAG: glycosyltransferase family 2 protein [Caulobacterales bacterium]|nr:glycosyltransferase family 2 protein [Caulobacterales bacterium]MCA0373826.1 glycosyltransferase family 2 protein [Pseudomonadota bacterium]
MRITVCLIAKNEGNYLLEWVAYYRNLGADKIVIYDNKSSDKSVQILKTLSKHGIIEFHTWNYGVLRSPQILAYRHAIKREKNEWILFVDADEFLVLHDKNNLHEFLAPFGDDKSISGVSINWRIFGDSGLKTHDARPIIERFTKASTHDFFPNHHVKCIYKTKDLTNKIHMHLCQTKNKLINTDGTDFINHEIFGLSEIINHEHAQINHYFGKTIEEYQTKMARGQAACRDSHEMKFCYKLENFHYHNRNDEIDISAQKYLGALKDEINHLNSIVLGL